MKKQKISKHIFGFLLSFAAVLLIGIGAGIAQAIPVLDFRNSKMNGLTIQKEIYRSQEETTPLRLGSETDKAYYDKNNLSSDDFLFHLWVGQSSDSMNTKANVPYTRFNQYGNFYHYVNFEISDTLLVDLIVKPLANGSYEVYYYDNDGKKVDNPTLTAKIGSASNANGYASLDIDGKFQKDFSTEETILSKPTKNFTTGSYGEFYLSDGSDGDQIYINDKELQNYAYYYITEDADLLKNLNKDKVSGEYKTDKVSAEYTKDTSTGNLILSANPKNYTPEDANFFDMHNDFSRPTDAFVIKKSVNYFQNLSNPFQNDVFIFEVLVNESAPSDLTYTITEGETVVKSETTLSASPDDTTPARFELKANQQVNIIGMMKNTYIEVRELVMEDETLLNPYYSALTRTSVVDRNNHQYYEYVEEKDSEDAEKVVKSYIRWTGYFDKEAENKSKTNFVNIPNTMQISKNLSNKPSNADEYEFEFEIKKDGNVLEDTTDQLQYFLRDAGGDLYGRTGDLSQPFVTSMGKLRLKDGQTAMFVNLNPNVTYHTTEVQAYQGETVMTIHFNMDETEDIYTTRGRTVNTESSVSSTGEIYTFKNTYAPKTGLIVAKNVIDKYERVKPDIEYPFTLTQKVESEGEIKYKTVVTRYPDEITEEEKSNYVVISTAKIKIGNGTETDLTKFFKLKNGESALITGLEAGHIYRAEEPDPNLLKHAYSEDDEIEDKQFPHLFETEVRVDTDEPLIFYNDTFEFYEGDGEQKQKGTAYSKDISLGATGSRNVSFTNIARQFKYYFDIEKIIFLDQNAHGTEPQYDDHQEQRFIFKVERFKENETTFSSANVQETFYVDMSCTKLMEYDNNIVYIDNNGDNVINKTSEPYSYTFYTSKDNLSDTKSTFIPDDVKIQKDYSNSDVLGSTNYIYPCTIYSGRKTVMVTKKGYYRVTEVEDWSSTDYDFWKGSNQYKGFGDGTQGETKAETVRDADSETPLPAGSENSVIFSVSHVKANRFETPVWEATLIIDENTTKNVNFYRPTASFTNSESEFAFNSSQAYAENQIDRE